RVCALRCTCAIGISASAALALEERRLVGRCVLLEQIIEIAFPVAWLRGPGKGAWKSRVRPARHHPSSVMQHAQRPQRLDDDQLAELEVGELLISPEELLPLLLLLGGGSGKHHPQVLHPRPHGAIVQVDKQRTVLVPQQIPEMAIAM